MMAASEMAGEACVLDQHGKGNGEVLWFIRRASRCFFLQTARNTCIFFFESQIDGHIAASGGLPVWALQALTGDKVNSYQLDDAGRHWEKCEMVHKRDNEKKRHVMSQMNACSNPP